MHIVLMEAGMNEPSNSAYLADRFAEGIATIPGIEVKTLRLRNLSIEHFDLTHYDPQTDQGNDFRMVQEAIMNAAGFVIATPVWNFGVPGHLKNLIDRMGSFALDAETRTKGMLGGKPFFLIFTGGSPDAAWKGLGVKTTSFLPVALKFFGGAHCGAHYEPRCMKGKGIFGLVVDQRPASIEAVKRKGADFARTVKTFTDTGKLPLKQAYLTRFYAVGQWVYRKFF